MFNKKLKEESKKLNKKMEDLETEVRDLHSRVNRINQQYDAEFHNIKFPKGEILIRQNQRFHINIPYNNNLTSFNYKEQYYPDDYSVFYFYVKNGIVQNVSVTNDFTKVTEFKIYLKDDKSYIALKSEDIIKYYIVDKTKNCVIEYDNNDTIFNNVKWTKYQTKS